MKNSKVKTKDTYFTFLIPYSVRKDLTGFAMAALIDS